jgi:hypothetical protein
MRERFRQFPLLPTTRAEFHEARARAAAMRNEWDEADQAITDMLAIAETFKLSELVIRGDTARLAIARREVPTLYRFQPHRTATQQLVNHAEQTVAASIQALQAVGADVPARRLVSAPATVRRAVVLGSR